MNELIDPPFAPRIRNAERNVKIKYVNMENNSK